MNSQNDFILAALKQEGLLRPADEQRAQRHAADHGVSMCAALVALGLLKPRDLAIVHATVAECPFVDLDHYDVQIKNAALLPRAAAEKLLAFPLFEIAGLTVVGMADPLDLKAVDRVRQSIRGDLETVLCEPEALRALIERAYTMAGTVDEGSSAGAQPSTDAVDNDEPIVAAVNQILLRAVQEGASDIHIGPDEHELHLRYRVDGVLQTRQGPPLSAHQGIVQRLKVMAQLDLTVSRRPQDGKFRFVHNSKSVDVRLSVIPTVTGENVVMRLLTGGAVIGTLDDLGFSPAVKARAEEMLDHPHGMILVTGPTGSGKTTTLYTFIKRLNTPDVNIITIEDPVEIRLPLVRQVQAQAEIGFTFATALRSILRQDPDIVLLGEIRDEETARIAVQAALTGHLVLSTLHTNDAPGAVARLRDFGLPGFAINAAVLGVFAQRLVRRVCSECARPYTPPEALVRRFLDEPEGASATFRKGSGCPKCLGIGSRGRLGVYELLTMDREIQGAIESGASTALIRQHAIARGMRPLWLDGLDKARLGLTTLEEIAGVAAGALEDDRRAVSPSEAESMMRLIA